MSELADDVWRRMAAVVHQNRDGWKRAVIEQSGLPFSRIRVLKRLASEPMTVKGVAEAAAMDAPAATVAVNDLEERGLVIRQTDPGDRRSKTVSLTARGRELLARIDAVEDPAPPVVAALSKTDLVALQDLLGKLS
ncbi:MarR family winged helix-turn-helix transcriptional regulator [Mycolicibacterium diernhoferi]|uniref:MarR family transcriptional regulator n=1 Tax=Mycolicibacterium diernhoferi TaxID=1801 RepID=A0A1Q4H609_9MYCO|nr:MarR family transcriptional regulator [Mycolicibacterium diernhoferi]OJZ62990.1 MarR family transcriptional regulator [Mycolicibacterium diernhoferi]OPE45372.1 MarR family transcriptional regulator [Mycolicibacterium diernhoferi]PEG53066.1 MarR family transcriptional regulator [Mycolicibacterium diernhoferi]QYL22037.1 MarR family transcriptional regulator [Mycolicibacterium diernhoferi]